MVFSFLKDFQQQAATKLAQFNNGTFKDGVMAVCALVAAADGVIEPEEKSKVAGLIQRNEMLQVFNATELKNTFLKYCDMASDEFSRLDLINTVRRLKPNEAQSDTALKIALIIANSDGDFAESEKQVVRELCKVLSLPEENYLT